MTLYESMMVSCTMLDKRSVPDGLGGFTFEWTDGATFSAAVVKNDSIAARVAEKEGVSEVYSVVTKGIPLSFHDVFRRDSDGAVFRITSNSVDTTSPEVATFRINKVSAERWELP